MPRRKRQRHRFSFDCPKSNIVVEFEGARRKQHMNVRCAADATDQVEEDVQSPASKVKLACKRIQLINEDVNRLQRCQAKNEITGWSR